MQVIEDDSKQMTVFEPLSEEGIFDVGLFS